MILNIDLIKVEQVIIYKIPLIMMLRAQAILDKALILHVFLDILISLAYLHIQENMILKKPQAALINLNKL